MSEIKVNEIKRALSNTIGSVKRLNVTVVQERVKTLVIIKKIDELTSRLENIERMIESSKTTKKEKKQVQKEITIDN
tara:strand:+ start:415 stop:645 length:231 start_codon:yes stop_codon:yes gene_type:complete